MFATGNHDVELFTASLDADATTIGYYGSIGYGGHAQRLDLPENGPGKCPSVYSFSYGNVGVVSVDANDLSYEIQGLLGYSGGAQARWLKQKLAEFRSSPEIDFIIAFYHHCAFSTCQSHSSDGGVRKVVAPLFAEYEVDLAIQGHNHLYERSNPIRYDAATNTGKSSVAAVSLSAADPAIVYPEKDGTTYMTVGSAGRPRYAWAGAVEADRNFLAGVNTGKPGNGTVVPADAKTGVGPYASQLDFTDAYETVDWSQARYRDYAFIALDVVPAAPDGTASRVSSSTGSSSAARSAASADNAQSLVPARPGPVSWARAYLLKAVTRRLRSSARVARTTWTGSTPCRGTVVMSGWMISARRPVEAMATACPAAMSSSLSSRASIRGPPGAGRPSGRGSMRQYAFQAGSGSRGMGSSAMSSRVTDSLPASR
jgi:hypothetical protein